VALGSESGHLVLWHRLNDSKPLERIKVCEKPVNCAAFSKKNPELLALACDDHFLRVYTTIKTKITVDTEHAKLKARQSSQLEDNSIKARVN
jgi:hypothetical protein